MSARFDLKGIDELTGGKLGVHDTPCPLCGPARKAANQRKRVLRIWRLDPAFASFHCVHCLEHGHVRDGDVAHVDPVAIERARADALERARITKYEQHRKARWLYSSSLPLAGTIGEDYLREARACRGALPLIIRFRPARDPYCPAIIVPYGIPDEPEPGILAISKAKITAVHLVLLKADGSGKADVERPKVTVGSPAGMPMVLAPMNDLLGLAICEGVEDALTVHAATGLAGWASGGASFMPKIAAAVPDYTDAVTVYADADEDGQRFARELAEALVVRGFEVFVEGMAP